MRAGRTQRAQVSQALVTQAGEESLQPNIYGAREWSRNESSC
jgi:hypothetical protein